MVKKRDYSDWSKTELIKEIDVLRKQKTYGLVWEKDKTTETFDYYINWAGDKIKEKFPESEHKFPVLKEVKNKDITNNEEESYNILIEGDNYHSLAVLNFTHRKAIDIIYIDPPYNTGNKDFKYNDRWVDKEDSYRHSKWLTFMEKRLKISRNLLRDDGLIFISINEIECFQLKILCDEIFGENNFVECVVWTKNATKNDSKEFATVHEYVLVYARNLNHRRNKGIRILVPKPGHDDVMQMVEKWNESQPSLLEAKKQLHEFYKNNDNLLGLKQYKHVERIGKNYFVFREDNAAWPQGEGPRYDVIHPTTKKKCKLPARGWRWKQDTFNELLRKNLIVFGKDEKKIPQFKRHLHLMPKNVAKSVYYNNDDGDIELRGIFGKTAFEHPKPTSLISWIISLSHRNSVTVLDYFAGTGTTGHAALKMEQSHNIQTKFILCTNNENGICEKICFPRLSKVTNGYTNSKGKKIKGLGGNIKYFKTDFVSSAPTDASKKIIVEKSTEMICLKENAFTSVKSTKKFKIYRNNKIYLGIIFDDEKIEEFIKVAEKLNGKFHIYVFSLDSSVPEFEFRELKGGVKLCPIPEAILHVYRRVFKDV